MQIRIERTRTSETIAFDRLHALIERGYRPVFHTARKDDQFASVDLVHPKVKGDRAPPSLTVWSNGVVSTTSVLWPKQLVETDGVPPIWQTFIGQADDALFGRFVEEVALPNTLDLIVYPALREAATISFMTIFATSLCAALAFTYRMAPAIMSA